MKFLLSHFLAVSLIRFWNRNSPFMQQKQREHKQRIENDENDLFNLNFKWIFTEKKLFFPFLIKQKQKMWINWEPDPFFSLACVCLRLYQRKKVYFFTWSFNVKNSSEFSGFSTKALNIIMCTEKEWKYEISFITLCEIFLCHLMFHVLCYFVTLILFWLSVSVTHVFDVLNRMKTIEIL